MSFEPLRFPIVFDQPRRLTDVESWHGHIPFAFFAVAALRPRVLVELGTWKGDSYCAFCQAVQALELPARCHAVDTWQGDEHTGAYGPEVLDELRAHHDPLYGSFSTLHQQRFDEAVPVFADGSVDVLHVDGAHSYEAVSHDVETWLPKLSERGVLLLHDTAVRDPGFGVWRLWEELEPHYPGFAFTHAHGLGVLAVGAEVDAAFTEFLAAARADPLAERFFSALGSRIADPARERRAGMSAAWAADQRALAAEREALAAEREALAAQAGRAAAGRELDDAQAALARTRAERDVLRLERDRLEADLRDREADLRDREADLAGVIESVSWRITAPLRSAKRDVGGLRRLAWRARMARRRRLPRGTAPRPAPAPPDLAQLRARPLVSVVTPVFDTDPEWLRRAVESVRAPDVPPLAALPRGRRLDQRARPWPTCARSKTSRRSTCRSARTAASRRPRTARSRSPGASSSRSSTTTTSSSPTRCSSACGCSTSGPSST